MEHKLFHTTVICDFPKMTSSYRVPKQNRHPLKNAVWVFCDPLGMPNQKIWVLNHEIFFCISVLLGVPCSPHKKGGTNEATVAIDRPTIRSVSSTRSYKGERKGYLSIPPSDASFGASYILNTLLGFKKLARYVFKVNPILKWRSKGVRRSKYFYS